MKWVFLVYKVPSHPTSKRVYVWRKLKKMDAVPLQDAVFILPWSEKALEQFQWLAAEILEMKGDATVWESYAASPRQEEDLVRKFTENVNARYQALEDELDAFNAKTMPNERKSRLSRLIAEFMDIRYHDHFRSDKIVPIERRLEELTRSLRKQEVDRPLVEENQ